VTGSVGIWLSSGPIGISSLQAATATTPAAAAARAVLTPRPRDVGIIQPFFQGLSLTTS
jgi:hypothetical protein